MQTQTIKTVAIVGGGSAGWMTAALLSKLFQGLYRVRLIESEAIGTVGVGEATIPALKKFNELLQLDEDEFMRVTGATFKLGIRFRDWHKIGADYVHGFGVIGQDLEWLRCHHFWIKLNQMGMASEFANYSINTAACATNKFMRATPNMPESPLGHIAHAFHFDASLYAKFLRTYSESRGVERTEAKVASVNLRTEDGAIESLNMDSGEVIHADLFIDCSGFRALLIEGALQTGYDDWSHWLPCDRALAVPCTRSDNFTPYTTSTARTAGWQWRIPLQHRTGNGLVYCSAYMAEAEAEAVLLGNLDGRQLAEPNRIRFTTGKRKKMWNKNCVAVGLAGGFLEPLESTSLHLIQSAVIRLIRLFPDDHWDQANIDEYNRQTDYEYERIRDFIILHYKATQRDDTPFWRYCRDMDVPETLQRKMELFQANGRIFREDDELFAEESWIQVCIGQGLVPRSYDPLVDIKNAEQVQFYMKNIEHVVSQCVDKMPTHAEFVDRFCRSAFAV